MTLILERTTTPTAAGGRRLGRRVWLALVALSLIAAAGVVLAPRGTHVADPYLWFADEHVEERPGVTMVDGLPTVTYRAGLGVTGRQTNPVTITQWGLSHYSRGDTAAGVRAADWLVTHQRGDGAWVYSFDFYDPPADETMHAPWISALAQGQALSLLARAYRATGDRKYLTAGDRALLPFLKPLADGGVSRSWDGHPYFEEYPTKRPSFVLNGYLFTLIGLHDYAHQTGNTTARQLWEQGERTAAVLLPQFALGGRSSAYLLGFRKPGGPPATSILGSVYEPIQPTLVDTMYQLTRRPVYAHYADQWAPVGVPWWRVAGLLVLAAGIMVALVMLRRRRLA